MVDAHEIKASIPFTGKRSFAAIEGYRGLAALAVSTGHSVVFFTDYAPFHSYLAVDFFFILSGIVLAHSYDDRLMTGRINAWGFFKLRALRLYPVILMASLLAIFVHGLVLAAHSDATPFHDYPSLALSGVLTALLIPQVWMGEFFPLNMPFWSLFFELIVNIVYGAARRLLQGWRLVALILASVVAMIALTPPSLSFDQGFHTQYGWLALARACYGFFIGVFISRSVRGAPVNANLAFLGGCAALMAIFWAPQLAGVPFDLIATLFLLPPVAWLAVKIEPVGMLKRASRFMGKASYPLYAFNMPSVMLGAAIVTVTSLRHILAGWLIGIAFLGGSIWVAHGIDRLFDEPLRARLKRWLFPRNGRLNANPPYERWREIDEAERAQPRNRYSGELIGAHRPILGGGGGEGNGRAQPRTR